MKLVGTLSAIALSLGIVAASYTLANAYRYKYKQNQTVEVTGLGKKDFASDLVIWNASFEKKSYDLKMASQELKKDKALVRDFLVSKGIKSEEIVFSAIDINKEFDYSYNQNGQSQSVFSGYRLSQSVTVKSEELDKVDDVSREISNLISQGIELNSSQPNYYYSKIEDLKLELIAQATKNARKRAENMAEKSEARLGELQNARMGVFQITGQYSQEEYTYGGVYNTTSRDKTANVTVKLEFSIK